MSPNDIHVYNVHVIMSSAVHRPSESLLSHGVHFCVVPVQNFI